MDRVVRDLRQRIWNRIGVGSAVSVLALSGCDVPEPMMDSTDGSLSEVDLGLGEDSRTTQVQSDRTQAPEPVYEPVLLVSELAVQYDLVIRVEGARPGSVVTVEVSGPQELSLNLETDDEGVAQWTGRTGPGMTGGEWVAFRAEVDGVALPQQDWMVAEPFCNPDTVAGPGSVEDLEENLGIRVCGPQTLDGVCSTLTTLTNIEMHDMLVNSMEDLVPDNFRFNAMCVEESIQTACCYVLRVNDLNVNPPPAGGGGGGGWDAGRPFFVDGELRHPLPTSDAGWCEASGVAVDPAMPRSVRRRLARLWAQVAANEHASVASFARLTLELLYLGAPADLVMRATAAQADEVRHAEVAFEIASGFAERRVGPGRVNITGALADSLDARKILLAAVLEGCIHETISAAMVTKTAQLAVDPALAQTLAQVGEDETRHAELSWDLVQWLLVRHPEYAVDVAELVAGFSMGARPVEDPHVDWLMAHGQLPEAQEHDLSVELWNSTIRPALQALVGEARLAA